MAPCYFLKHLGLGVGLLLAGAGRARAQQLATDSVSRPPTLLVKAGLRLTHLRYTSTNMTWQFLLPLSLGAEYRAAPRLSLYTQLEADMLANSNSNSNTRRRGRGNASSAVSAASVALGVRYYYGHLHGAAPLFGRYLALEGSADWERVTARYVATGSGRRTTPTVLTPGVYALWGVQHRLRPHVLYDINAGAGVLAPAYYSFERPGSANHWNVGGQVNIRLYFSL